MVNGLWPLRPCDGILTLRINENLEFFSAIFIIVPATTLDFYFQKIIFMWYILVEVQENDWLKIKAETDHGKYEENRMNVSLPENIFFQEPFNADSKPEFK